MPLSIDAPGDAYAAPPEVPGLTMAPPTTGNAVVPVGGPVGPQGPPGDTAQTLAYIHQQPTPASSITIEHDLAFNPAGILCLESDGTQVEYASVTFPQLGFMILTFGFAFAGTVYIS